MDDVTDTVFRRVVADCAPPDFTMTEFVNVDGLCSPGRPKLMRKLDASLDTTPVLAQIWGKNPQNYKQIASEIASGLLGDPDYEAWLARELGSNKAQGSKENRESRTSGTATETRMQLTKRFAETVCSADSSAVWQANGSKFSGIDLNFGCPAKSEIKAGCCSALQQIELRPEAADIIEATIEGAGDMPISFKTRLGFHELDYSWHEFLLKYKPWLLTVHVRTTREMSKVPARWNAIKPIIELRDKISPDTKIIMNGDITNRQHGEEIVEQYGVDGVMIGRGIFHNPYAFAENAAKTWSDIVKDKRLELLKQHIELHVKKYPNAERPFNPLKKFAKVYISEFPGASELRAKIMDTTSAQDALMILEQAQ